MLVSYRELLFSPVQGMCVSKQEMKKKQNFLNVPFDVCELYKDSHLNVFKGLIDEDG